MMRNIILTGFMGCGKTVIGKAVSSYLKYGHVDTDDYIERKAGASITEIFRQFGEDYFRNLEAQAALEVSAYKKYVISTGGGIVKNEENMFRLKQNGAVFYLKSSPGKIFLNTKNDKGRPLLNGENRLAKIEQLMQQREPLYLKYADFIVDTTDLSVEAAAEKIVDLIKIK